MVILVDCSIWEVVLVGVVLEKDLAVLCIEVFWNILWLMLVGIFDNLQVGQLVYVIGNFFGLD